MHIQHDSTISRRNGILYVACSTYRGTNIGHYLSLLTQGAFLPTVVAIAPKSVEAYENLERVFFKSPKFQV